MSSGGGHRCGSNPTLLWLWCRLVAVAPIRRLVWKPPYAADAALKVKKKKKKKEFRQILHLIEMGINEHVLLVIKATYFIRYIAVFYVQWLTFCF